MNLNLDITKVTEGMSNFDKLVAINSQPVQLILLASIVISLFIIFLLLGAILGTGRKKMISTGNFWVLTITILCFLVFLLAINFIFPLILLVVK